MSLVGDRTPRIRVVPPYTSTAGPDVVKFAAKAGLILDPWQADCLDDFLAERPDGSWNTFENTLIVSRQNGKGAIFEALILASLFLFDDELVLYSAHEFKTASEMFLRLQALIKKSEAFSKRVRKIWTSHGDEGIETTTGQRLRVVARSSSSGRGFTGHKNFMDEAFKLDGAAISAMMPTMSAVENPQLYYMSSAGWEISIQLGRLRTRALDAMKAGEVDPSLAFLEWSAPDETDQTKPVMSDRKLWAMANPALGYRITEEFTANELRSMDAPSFARERLGIGDYPKDEEEQWTVIGEEVWESLADTTVTPADRVGRPAFCADTTPDRSYSAIAVAFRRPDGGVQLEVVDYRRGTKWVPGRLIELIEKYEPCAVVVDRAGSAASVVDDLEAEEVEVVQPSGYEVAEAYGQIYEALTETTDVHHCDQEELNTAVAGAANRKISDRSAWDRRGSTDICPLVAVTEAHWALRKFGNEGDALDNIW